MEGGEDFKIDDTVIKQRDGTIDAGRPYELKITALLTQRFASSDDISDFWVLTNVGNLGAFDDVVIYAIHTNKQRKLYLIQLKHTNKTISLNNIIADTGDFSLKKYETDYEKVKKSCGKNGLLKDVRIEDVVFILYTNTKFMVKSKNQEVSLSCVRRNPLVDTSDVDGNIYQFQNGSKNFDANFLNQFYFYTNQVHESGIEEILKSEWCSELDKKIEVNLFFDFILNWSTRGKIQKLYKQHVRYKLFESMLIPHISNPNVLVEFEHFELQNVLNETLINYNLTVVEARYNVVDIIWTSIQYTLKRIEKKLDILNFGADLSYTETSKFLNENSPITKARRHKSGTISNRNVYLSLFENNITPLIVSFQNTTANIINSAINKFKDVVKKRSIVLVKNSESSLTCREGLTYLKNLSDLPKNLFDKNFRRICINLQQKGDVPLSTFSNSISSAIDPSVYLKLITEQLIIEKQKLLPEYYIGRTLKVPMLYDDSIKNCLLIFHESDSFLKNIQEKTVDLLDYMKNLEGVKKENSFFKYSYVRIVTYSGIISQKFMENAAEKILHHTGFVIKLNKQTICFLKYHEDVNHFEVILYRGSARELQNNLVEYHLSEADLKFRSSRVNIICSNAGMGKSVMLDFLHNHSNPENWAVYIDLAEHANNIRSMSETSGKDYIKYILEYQMKNIPKVFHAVCKALFFERLNTGNMIWFIDGYDEEHSPEIQRFLIEICNTNVKFWVAARPSFKNYLENMLHTFSIDLCHFTEADQSNFFKVYFNSNNKKLEDKDVTKIVQYVRRSKLDESLIGIPLQIKMFANLINEDIINYNENESLTLADLYEKFIELKLKKYGRKNIELLDSIISKLSLTVFFTKDQLKNILDKEFKAQVEYFKEEKKGFLVTGFTESGEPLFAHRTYAEFLTVRCLAKMIFIEEENGVIIINKKYSSLIETLFYKEMVLLRFFFNSYICKNLPLHLAVLNNKTEDVRTLVTFADNANAVDQLGRNALHIAASFGEYYDLYFAHDIAGIQNIQKHVQISHQGENLNIEKPEKNETFHVTDFEIVKILLQHKHLLGTRDTIFHLDPVDYAIKTCSLEIVDEMYKLLPRRLDIFESYDVTCTLLYYCVKYWFNNILQRYCRNPRRSNFETFKVDINGESYLTCAVLSKNKEAVKILIKSKQFGINDFDTQRWTALHRACDIGDREMVKELIALGADVNARGLTWHFTPLHWACLHEDEEVIDELLLHKDIDINFNEGSEIIAACKRYNYERIVRKLLEKNAAMNANKNLAQTLLMQICENGYLDIFDKMDKISPGIFKEEINQTYYNNHSPLMIAVKNGHSLVCERILTKYSIDIEQLEAALNEASRLGETSLVILLLEKRGNLSQLSSEAIKENPRSGNDGTDATELILRKNIANDRQFSDSYYKTRLIYAAQEGFIDIIEELLTKKININLKDNTGKNVLMYASKNGQLGVVERLVKLQDIDVNLETDSGKNAFIFACEEGHTDIAKKLFESNRQLLNCFDIQKKTALMYAVENGHANVVEFLLENNVALNATDVAGRNAFMIACKNGYLTIVKDLLIESPELLNKADVNGTTPLIYASQKNANYDVVEFLLELMDSTAINKTDKGGRTPLVHAIQRCQQNIVGLLLRKNADANIPDKSGRSPITYTINEYPMFQYIWDNIRFGVLTSRTLATFIDDLNNPVETNADDIVQPEFVKSRLAYTTREYPISDYRLDGITFDSITNKGLGEFIAFEDSTNSEQTNFVSIRGAIAEQLFERDITIDNNDTFIRKLFLTSIVSGCFNIAQQLIAAGVNINAKCKYQVSAFEYACQKDSVNLVNTFLTHPKFDKTERNLASGLYIASRFGHFNIVRELLNYVKVNAVNAFGQTALMGACIGGHIKVVEYLLSLNNGVVNAASKENNMTALMYACREGCPEIVKLLISNGVKVDMKNKQRKTALIIARECLQSHLVYLLIQNDESASSNSLAHNTLRYTTIKLRKRKLEKIGSLIQCSRK